MVVSRLRASRRTKLRTDVEQSLIALVTKVARSPPCPSLAIARGGVKWPSSIGWRSSELGPTGLSVCVQAHQRAQVCLDANQRATVVKMLQTRW